MTNIFTNHPNEVGETYLQHMLAASRYSATFLLLVFVSLTHAILPFLFTRTASCVVQEMSAHIKEREGECNGTNS